MSARRIADKPANIPSNASFIEFERSDGDSRTWPTNTTRSVDADGQLNFMDPVDIDAGPAVRWRLNLAQGASVALNLPSGPTYVLRDWPSGYRLFDHNKGPADNPRHDLYLFGGKARFRSVNEFLPHIIWLLQDPMMDSANCQCKYCSKKPQKEVTAALPNVLIFGAGSGSQSPGPSRSKPRDKIRGMRETALQNAERNAQVFAAVQKAPKPLSKKAPNVADQVMLVERNADLRATHSRTGLKLKRWFRSGELVWCALDPPVPGLGPKAAIKFWPGIVDETNLRTEPIHVDGTSNGTPITSPSRSNPTNDEDVMFETRNSVPWSIRQSTVYKIRLLGVSQTHLAPDDRVLPYQAYVLPNDLIAELQAFPPQNLNFDRHKLSSFHPYPGGAPPAFADAIAPYAFAVQIGSALSGFWSLTDEWAFVYTMPAPRLQKRLSAPALVPSPPPPSTSQPAANGMPAHAPAPPPTDTGPISLKAAIEAASRHNTSHMTSASAPQPYPASGSKPNMPSSDVERLSTRLLGRQYLSDASVPPVQRTQLRFQGLWWGAERIWIDEFVRLKIPRRCLAPAGAEHILPPSGPGNESKNSWLAQGRDPSQVGAGSRSVFMRLDGLFVVDAVQPDGFTKKECRACGMLYELADLDWEEPNQETPTTQPIASTSQPARTTPPPDELSGDAAYACPSKQLSHPSSTPYFPPEAPEGYRFRPILQEGYEAVVSLSLIAGRYYPRILSHPLLADEVHKAISNPVLMEANNLWALEGLYPGFYNAVDPTIYKPSRTKMLEDADKQAMNDLEEYTREKLREMIPVDGLAIVDESAQGETMVVD